MHARSHPSQDRHQLNHFLLLLRLLLLLSLLPLLRLKMLTLRVKTTKGEAVPMAAGDELLILYKGGYTPLEAFLKFGFVADEWWQQ